MVVPCARRRSPSLITICGRVGAYFFSTFTPPGSVASASFQCSFLAELSLGQAPLADRRRSRTCLSNRRECLLPMLRSGKTYRRSPPPAGEEERAKQRGRSRARVGGRSLPAEPFADVSPPFPSGKGEVLVQSSREENPSVQALRERHPNFFSDTTLDRYFTWFPGSDLGA